MKKVGIIGGGQLGKMMILDGKRLDTQFSILDPTLNCPAHSIADKHIVAGFNDKEAIKRLAANVDVVTYEFEHISLQALQELEQMGYKVYPSSETLSHIQDKFHQKCWLKEHGIPVPEFMQIKSWQDIYQAGERYGYPFVLKASTGGYDGKGNFVVNNENEVIFAYKALGQGTLALMAEKFIPFTKEVSVLACRSLDGSLSVFPVAENKHKNSILDETIVPARIGEDTTREAMAIAEQCLTVFQAYGMLCIELFVTKEGHVLVNELAPRPHNSGHYTIEGCWTSQYEQHVRAILGMPLGNPNLIAPTAMKNLIGDRSGTADVHGLEDAYKFPNAKIHIYGKQTVTPGRKMGHITACASTIEEALRQVRGAYDAITIGPVRMIQGDEKKTI